MAKRPVFVPDSTDRLVQELELEFEWFPGFAPSQKQKSARALHAAASQAGFEPVLEVSSKSWERLGSQLSAFHLKADINGEQIPVEVVFQAAKVYERGGPFPDMLGMAPLEARRDPRHGSSGALLRFSLEDVEWLLSTGTLFYDSLYLRALAGSEEGDELLRYAGFTDIEFNPKRSLNCQARSCALYVSLAQRGYAMEAARDVDFLLDIASEYAKLTPALNASVTSQLNQSTSASDSGDDRLFDPFA